MMNQDFVESAKKQAWVYSAQEIPQTQQAEVNTFSEKLQSMQWNQDSESA